MLVIDAHHHLWCPTNDAPGINYVWLKNIGAMKPFGDPTAIQRDYLPDEFQQESSEHQLIGSVHVQADGAIPDPVIESLWLETLHEQYTLPSAHIGFLDLSSETAPEVLERYLVMPGFRGVRQILSRLEDRPELCFAAEHYLDNSRWTEQYALLAKHALSFDLQLYPEQMPAAAEFLAQHPDIPVVIDHAGSPYQQTPEGLANWRQGMSLLAELPHCMVKLSGLGMFDRNWSAESIAPMFDHMADTFGANRMMWGSNFPVDKLMQRYDYGIQQLLDCAQHIGMSDSEQSALFAGSADQFYRLNKL